MTYSWSFFLTVLVYSWSFFACNGKVCLIRASRDCKQRISTANEKTPTVSKKTSPFLFPVFRAGAREGTVILLFSQFFEIVCVGGLPGPVKGKWSPKARIFFVKWPFSCTRQSSSCATLPILKKREGVADALRGYPAFDGNSERGSKGL